jgi:quercetin dioxygenase-like cupin family protein
MARVVAGGMGAWLRSNNQPMEESMGIVRRLRVIDSSFRWDGVDMREEAAGVTRQVIIGPADGASYAVRYFEVPPNGRTALDQHEHTHGVVILRGQGRVRLGEREVNVAMGDAIFIPGNEIHQFVNIGQDPFGFLCIKDNP